MKRFLCSFLLTLLTIPALLAQDLTREEINTAIKYLEKTRADVVAATQGLSDAQWHFKPATNRWSVAEVIEHIAASEDFLMEMIKTNVMRAPARTQAEDLKAIDGMILNRVPDRTAKVQAPEPLQPNNRFGSPRETMKHFRDSRARTIAFLRKTKDLRQHAVDSPFGKQLDGYQWLLFIAAHSERHTKQLIEVKADPNYPKR
jgi:hypothetical protein